MLKKILSCLIILIICISITLPALAFDTANYKPSLSGNTGEISKLGNTIVKVIKIIGSALSVIILAIIGIKYIYGSLEQKAQYKETIMPYIVGAIMLFGSSQLVGYIYSVALK